jgi:histidyl-tRNA synthetase
MPKLLANVRGMTPLPFDQVAHAKVVEDRLINVIKKYGFKELRFPIIEFSELFTRNLGEETDIVTKEIYQFDDRNGDKLSLRPEGTAGCIRSALDQGLLRANGQKFWYSGPMFRHERPQKGRYRQFHQLGVEAFGMPAPYIDIEILLLGNEMLNACNLDSVLLEVNYLASNENRARFTKALVTYFNKHRSDLDEQEILRIDKNPLRILDSKKDSVKKLISNAPQMIDYISNKERDEFSLICSNLQKNKINFKHNPYLVRGLDYYNGLVFEWVSDQLGAQGTVCAGGRFDSLVEQIGGQPTPAVGFALGLERLISLAPINYQSNLNHLYFIASGIESKQLSQSLAAETRACVDKMIVEIDCIDSSTKNQQKRAERSGATFAIIVDKINNPTSPIKVKPLKNQLTPKDQLTTTEFKQWLNDLKQIQTSKE